MAAKKQSAKKPKTRQAPTPKKAKKAAPVKAQKVEKLPAEEKTSFGENPFHLHERRRKR